MKRFQLIVIFLLMAVTPLLASNTEFRTIRDAGGLDAETMGYGNVNSFGTTALSVVGAPVTDIVSQREASAYYGSMMGSEARLFAGALHQRVNKLSLGLGYINETIDAGYETSSANNTVTEGKALTFKSTEIILNASYRYTHQLILGSSLHYYSRDAFDVKGSAVGLSLGGRYETDRYGVSFGGKNINAPTVRYSNDAEETVYSDWYAGVKTNVPLPFPITWYGQFNWTPQASSTRYGTGVQIPLTPYFSINLGYMQLRTIGSRIDDRMTLGTSISFDGLSLNYVFNTSDYVESPNQHRVTISAEF